MRRRLGRHHARRAAAHAPGLGDGGAGLSRLAVPTAEGPAVVELTFPVGVPRALVALGHGAGGGIESADLAGLARGLPAAGFAVARVEQPYRVAGRRTPPTANRLDAGWLTAVADLRARPELAGLGLVVGGRSSGARVACRTATAAGAVAVLALAFPLHPPGRQVSRLDELLAVDLPTLVVQGARDPFGSAADFPAGLPDTIEVVEVAAADHAFRCRRADDRTTQQCLRDVETTVTGWLEHRVALRQTPAG